MYNICIVWNVYLLYHDLKLETHNTCLTMYVRMYACKYVCIRD